MRPYGVYIPQCLDVDDILTIGAKSSIGARRGRSGHYRGYSHGPSKARTRRYWKRVARAEGKAAARERD
ncbi:MAG TPA: hypothetical protein VKP30_12940 [Polyangiaceae bacterium]|nr:hypothetical protein [Polyangiaceae bacterium]